MLPPLQTGSISYDEQPIHNPGSIQSRGVLFAFKKPEFIFLQVSENTDDHLGVSPFDLLGKPLTALFSASQIKKIKDILNNRFAETIPFKFILPIGTRRHSFDCVLHQTTETILLEMEPTLPCRSTSIYQRARSISARFRNMFDGQSLGQLAVQELRELTGFDRVMIYQFDEQWNGLVLAEDSAGHMPSFLGLHFPAADIPDQARKLFLQNRTRVLDDCLTPFAQLISAPQSCLPEALDLSSCSLRSAHSIHIEYLGNMGVVASMTIALTHNDKLWGLVVFHHATPRKVPGELRQACQDICQILSLELSAIEERVDYNYRIALKSSQAKFVEFMSQAENFLSALRGNRPDLLNPVRADGVVLSFNGEYTLFGKTPPQAHLGRLIAWLDRQEGYFCTDSLSSVYPEAKAFRAVASGLLAMPILLAGQKNYVLWFRAEILHILDWGGDPEHVVTIDDQQKLHPRRSFALWKQLVEFRSLPWRQWEVDAAFELRASMLGIEKSLRLGETNALLKQEIQERRSIETQLHLAKDFAESANRAKGVFLANVSHEIRTPLNGIVGMAGLLLQTDLSVEQHEYAQVMRSSGDALLTVINDLLDFSKIEAGKLDLEQIPVDLYLLVKTVVALLSERASSKHLTLTWQIDPNVPRLVLTDPVRLQQILINLLGNAVKFTENGKIHIHFAMLNALTLRCNVQDSGIGIATENLQHLFKPFSQADGSTTRKYGGTGLGLAICQQLVTLMGGNIGVETSLGKGSTFWFSVPAIAVIAEPPRILEQDNLADLKTLQNHGQIRILLAEDNPINQMVAQRQLAKLGCHVTVVSNGQEALEALAQDEYTLILMDCQMPVMDGFLTTKEIRRQFGHKKHIPIIAMTANVMNGEKQLCLDCGMDDYLAKPVTVKTLGETVLRWSLTSSQFLLENSGNKSNR
ncbi:MAG: response regulator [Anaerolineae bacterium]|nr:response regulator [Gloeobacterales cyanobacterium ES-bin-313]